MHFQPLRSFVLLPAILLILGAAGATASPVVSGVASGPNVPSTTTDEVAYAADVSGSDLLHGIAGTGGSWNASGSHPDGLNDGNPGGDFDQVGISALSGAAWAIDGHNQSFRVFELGAGAGGLGYDLTGIQSIAAWQGAGFANQRYEVRVRLAGAGSFQTLPLVTVNYQPFSAALNEGGSTRVRVIDSAGVLVSGVTAIRFDVLDTVGNPAGGTVFREIDVFGVPTAGRTDTVPPIAVALSPEANQMNVAAGMVMSAVFHENIVLGTGGISIKNLTTGTQATISLPDPRVTISGRTLVIRPGILLGPATHYAIRIGSGVVKDSSGNAFAGIDNDSTWDFTTAELISSESSPLLLNFAGHLSGLDLLQGIGPLTTGWNFGNGAHPSKLTDGIHGTTLAAAGNVVQGAWTTVGATAEYSLGIGPEGTGYDVFSIQSIAAWENVGFGNQAWTVAVKPAGGSYQNLATVDYQPLAAGGATKVVMNGTGPVLAGGIEAIRFTAKQVNNGANAGAFVFREIDVFGEPSGPPIGPPDVTPPAIVTFAPVDGAADVPPGASLVVTFDENVTSGVGSIRLRNLETSVETAIAANDPQITVFGDTVTINPSPKLSPRTRYAVKIDAGAIRDYRGNPFAGILDDTTWNFTTTTTPLRIMPMGDSITAGYTDNPNWNEPFWYGYRSGLYNRLHDAGYHFAFVGQSPELPDHVTGTTPPADLAALGQNAHNGYGGQSASYLNANILSWLAADEPDVILLMIGTNSQDQTGLDTLVNTIVTARPALHLVIAQIIPKYNYQQGVVDYNSWIRNTLLPKYQGMGKNVTMVNQYAPFLTNPTDLTTINQPLFSNGINHPSNVGYDRMAQVWFAGVEELGLRPLSYSTWIANPVYAIAPGLQGFADDPDGDGIANGLEAWFGTHPGRASSGLSEIAPTAAGFTFSHPVNLDPPQDVATTYQWSSDLIQWFEADGSDGPPGGPRVACTVEVTGSTARVTATITQPSGRMFVRLAANVSE